MLWVRHETEWKPATRNQRLLAVRLLLEEQTRGRLAGLPAGAVIHGAELPRVGSRLPKTLPGGVFAQWVDPANLALLDERDRTIVLVLAFTGFRVSSVVTLMRDCLELGSDGTPVSALLQRQGQPRGDAADPAAARRAAPAPGGVTWPSATQRRSGCSPRRCTAARSAARFTSIRARWRT